MRNFLLFITFICIAVTTIGQSNFSTSLHATREGKNDAYKAENGGMELITNIPMDDLSCKNCHSKTGLYPNGDTIDPATYEPSCNDCHDMSQGTAVAEQTCLNCHNRQVYERDAYPDVDVHHAGGVSCIDCHSKEELHGDDGVEYASLKQSGAIKVECEDCHTPLTSNSAHDTHAETVDCAACHAEGILTCASCHFETTLATGKNRAINKLKNYRLLVKKDGEIRLGAFMTHTYDGKTNFIVNSYHSHAITKNATTCADCHYNMGATNAAIEEYNESGTMTMTTWNEETKKITGPSGVVPLTSDWETAMNFDFATYTGDPNVFPSDPEAWEYLKSEVDNSHLYYCEPLDPSTLTKLGFTQVPSAINEYIQFSLNQNFPNPFSSYTRISYSLSKNAFVSLKVYDASGKVIRIMEEGSQNPGQYEIKMSADDLPTGIFFIVRWR
ncbi:MAG: T9SS type A sorting domain-containing protein [Bacteroidales bacterium]|nr:T9SS type A sorting domain-containing protein [Bacteroidales bacterium]